MPRADPAARSRLASALLPVAALLITPRTRGGLFADPVRLPGSACPGDQFLAFLGRQPRSPAAAEFLLQRAHPNTEPVCVILRRTDGDQ